MNNEMFHEALNGVLGRKGDAPVTRTTTAPADLPPGFDVIYEKIMDGDEHVYRAFQDLLVAKAEHAAACNAWANAVELFELQTDLPLPRPQRKGYQPERHTDHPDTVALTFRGRTVRIEKASVEEIAKVAADAALGKLPTAKQLRAMPDDHPVKRGIATKGELHRRYPGEFEYPKEFQLALAAGLI